MNTPFSVLISLYKANPPDFFDQALASIFEQTYPPTEVVLVIDGEKTAAQQRVIDKYSAKYPLALKVVPIEQNIGQGPALNEGLKHCSYELVARMDTDDICKPSRFEKQVALFEQNPQIDIAGAWIDEFYDTPGEVASTRKLPETHEELKQYAQSRCPMNHPVVMYRKSSVQAVGGYQRLGTFDDYLLWMKMLRDGAVFHNIQESLLFFRASRDMAARRGGWRYAVSELKAQLLFYRWGTVSLARCLKNIAIRFPVRMLPTKLRALVYRHLLR